MWFRFNKRNEKTKDNIARARCHGLLMRTLVLAAMFSVSIPFKTHAAVDTAGIGTAYKKGQKNPYTGKKSKGRNTKKAVMNAEMTSTGIGSKKVYNSDKTYYVQLYSYVDKDGKTHYTNDKSVAYENAISEKIEYMKAKYADIPEFSEISAALNSGKELISNSSSNNGRLNQLYGRYKNAESEYQNYKDEFDKSKFHTNTTIGSPSPRKKQKYHPDPNMIIDKNGTIDDSTTIGVNSGRFYYVKNQMGQKELEMFNTALSYILVSMDYENKTDGTVFERKKSDSSGNSNYGSDGESYSSGSSDYNGGSSAGQVLVNGLSAGATIDQTAQNPDFTSWDDEDNKEAALTAYMNTSWDNVSDLLTFETNLGNNTKRAVEGCSDKVLSWKEKIKSVIGSMENPTAPPSDDYVEIMLCLMQVMSGGDPPDNDPYNVKKYFWDSSKQNETIDAETSIKTVFEKLTTAIAVHNANRDDDGDEDSGWSTTGNTAQETDTDDSEVYEGPDADNDSTDTTDDSLSPSGPDKDPDLQDDSASSASPDEDDSPSGTGSGVSQGSPDAQTSAQNILSVSTDGNTGNVVATESSADKAIDKVNGSSSQKEFIKQVAAYAKKYAPQYGISIVSPVIAQACLESGYGTSHLAKANHNYFGMKKSGGGWQSFSSLEESVKGYFELVSKPRYSNLKGITDPAKYLLTIGQDGYCSPASSYQKNNMAIVNKWELTAYDKEIGASSSSTGTKSNIWHATIYQNNDELKACVEAVLLGSNYADAYRSYSKEDAQKYYEEHKDKYSGFALQPSADFAEQVCSHYKVTAKTILNVNTGSSTTDTGNYYKLGTALAVLHADDNGNLSKVKKAVERGFYAVEADVHLRGGTLYCYHSNYKSGTSPTFQETYNTAKQKNAKVVIDLKDSSSGALSAIASFIASNQAYDDIIIQTNSKSAMKTLNSKAGQTLTYWGLVMNTSGTLNTFLSSASSYQELGMKAVNIPRIAGNYKLGNQSNIKKLTNAGYEVCVFAWGKFSDSEISNYCSYGAKYLMTNKAEN